MKRFVIVVLCTVLPLVFVNRANAYLDPGTGSMIIQAVIAAVAVVTVSVGIYWRRLKAFLSGLFGRKRDE
ncbi:MAG: hypothetical protein JW920_01545 [Deltaproteobacteria bacterium]|nr:hypothetical protein [Deltaproteobacteria bacterium]